MRSPLLSVVVVAYNMAREIPRTIRTLSPLMQRGVQANDYEIILVDNCSSIPLNYELFSGWGANIRFHRMSAAGVSPASAVNTGIDLARGELVGVMIDGARMASPGLLASAVTAQRLHKRPIISTLAFHLGPTVQSLSVHQGYNQAVEDRLLESVDWESDGYRLFEISVFDASSAGGWFRPLSESNALFMPRPMWQELAGFDERFVTPGGGHVNLDTYRRACDLPESRLIVLVGEGTFHQFHHGIATNALKSHAPEFDDEYLRIRHQPFTPPGNEAWLFGKPNRAALPFILASAQAAMPPKRAAEPRDHWLLVNSLYKTAFGRTADEVDLADRMYQLRSGTSPEVLAEELTGSAEFQSRHGSSEKVDTEFLTALYRDGLGRRPDPEGLAHWLAQGEKGTTRGQVLAAFAQSTEALSLLALMLCRPGSTSSIDRFWREN
jgi:hypothetical protein